MQHYDLALEHCAKIPYSSGRFEAYDAFVAGYEAALNQLKMPTIEKAVATLDKPSDNKGSAQQAA
jgi:hypothetical protein